MLTLHHNSYDHADRGQTKKQFFDKLPILRDWKGESECFTKTGENDENEL